MELGQQFLRPLIREARCSEPGTEGNNSDATPPSGAPEADHKSPPDVLDQYAPIIVRGAVIGTGLLGIAVFARSLRLFTQFQHGRDIPEEFIRKGVRLRGRLSTVEEDGSLRVCHQPLARLPRLFTLGRQTYPGLLTLRLAGVEVSGAGTSFLRQNLGSEYAGNGKILSFSLIHRSPKEERDAVYAEVTSKLGTFPWWSYNINQELVRRGLARVPSTAVPEHVTLLRQSPAYSRLVNQLLISERIADRRGVGMWQRDTWVEGMQALPSQAKGMVEASSIWRFLVLLGIAGRSAVKTTVKAGMWTLKTGAQVGGATYRGSQLAIREGSHVYQITKEGGEKALTVTRSAWETINGWTAKIRLGIEAVRARLLGTKK